MLLFEPRNRATRVQNRCQQKPKGKAIYRM